MLLHSKKRRKSVEDSITVRHQHPTIAQVVGYYPPSLGGMEVVAQEVSLQLARDGWPVEVITSRTGSGTAPHMEREKNYLVRRLATFEFAHTPFMPNLLWRLWRVKKPAIYHLHLSQIYLPEMVWLVAKIRRMPYVVHFHLDVEPSGRFGALFLLYKRWVQPVILRSADYVVTLSSEQRDMVMKRYRLPADRVRYIPNGVAEKYSQIGEEPRSLHEPLRLLFVGRLATQKRVERLVEAMSYMEQGPVSLCVVGDGEDYVSLQALTKKLHLKNVTFSGALHGTDVLNAYRDADAFVLPSDREGMPLVLFEAMATGLPVIGSNVQGIREHLGGIGILVEDPSPKTFALALDKCYLHRKDWFPLLSKASRRKAAQYTWPKLTVQLEKIYMDLEEKAAPRPFTRRGLLGGVAAWWAVFLGLRLVPGMPEVITNTVGFSFLTLVPGMLTVLCLRIRTAAAWGKLALAVGFSILELMSVALLGNTVLQWFGVARPLDTTVLIPEFSLLLAVLMWFVYYHVKGWELDIRHKLYHLLPTRVDWWIALIPLFFVLLSILGANSLNNGGTDFWTMTMLIGVAVYSLVLVYKSRKLTDTSVATAIFLTALAVLLMNSLRGWYTTGHDIQQEYWVFQLAKTHGVWKIQAFRNPYNACLSITILPTIFANLLKVFDPYVYKIFFQIIFATCPAVIYLFFRRWASVAVAFLSAFYFIAFPTFFTDMSFLNRQEIAFVFFILMLYIIFQSQVSLIYRKVLFMLMGLGLILSHYSTTYSVIAILFLAAAAWPLVVKGGAWLRHRPVFRHAALSAVYATRKEVQRVTFGMVMLFACGSILWTTVLTNTGGSTAMILRQTVSAIGSSFKPDQPKSTNTEYSLLSFSTASPIQQFDDYLKTVVQPARRAEPTLYYPASTYAHYHLKITTDAVQPLTRIGRYLSRIGLNVAPFNFAFRQATAKLLQILVISGFIYILFRRTYTKLLESDFIALSIGSVIFIALQVVLPVLSVQYGLLRAFQQSLMLLGLLTVVGSIALFAWIPSKALRLGLPALLAVLFFLSSTGVITQALGGYYPQLNLSNSGVYYDSYYTHAQEIAGIQWLNGVAGKTVDGRFVQEPVQIDDYTYSKLSTYTQLTPANDIYPGLIQKDAYVFLGYSNINQDEATAAYNGDLITYTYPVQFLNQQKNLIYSNGGTEVYQ